MATKLSQFHHDPQGGFFTTSLFWDCECDDNEQYIHPFTEDYCIVCRMTREDSPDARLDEVIVNARRFGLDDALVETACRDAGLEPIPY